MSFDFANWALGIVSALLVGIIGRLIYHYINSKLSKKPLLRWYVIESVRIPADKGIFSEIDNLIRSARSSDPDKIDEEKLRSLYQQSYRARESVLLDIENSGNAAAECVSILTSETPFHISVSPSVPIKSQETADGKCELEVSSIEANSRVRLILFGVEEFQIKRVAHKGISAEKPLRSRLVSFEEEIQKKVTGFKISALVAVAAFIFGFLVALVEVADLLRESDKNSTTQNEVPKT